MEVLKPSHVREEQIPKKGNVTVTEVKKNKSWERAELSSGVR